jgi:hypothetical protein
MARWSAKRNNLIGLRRRAGVPDNVVRTVTENSRKLKFENSGFEIE